MTKSRRTFLNEAAQIAGALGLGRFAWNRFENQLNVAAPQAPTLSTNAKSTPVMVSTWNHGILANAAGMEAQNQGGNALDMIEAAARLVESDAEGLSVGLGGLPDRDGHVTLDACIMDHTGNAGSVCFVQGIEHPLSLARRVMEDTPHVMLSGAGAEQYARELDFPQINLLTPKAQKAWDKWRIESDYAPVINRENHDTIGLLALGSRRTFGRRVHHERRRVQNARPGWGQSHHWRWDCLWMVSSEALLLRDWEKPSCGLLDPSWSWN